MWKFEINENENYKAPSVRTLSEPYKLIYNLFSSFLLGKKYSWKAISECNINRLPVADIQLWRQVFFPAIAIKIHIL